VWLNEYWPAAAAGLLPGDATGWLSRERQGVRMVRSHAGRSALGRRGLTMAVVVACLILAPSSSGASARDASPAVRAQGGWEDPLAPMVRRTDDYLQQFEVDGVTMDWRYSVIPSEEIRQTVVCQLLAYVELARLDPRPRLRYLSSEYARASCADKLAAEHPHTGYAEQGQLAAARMQVENNELAAAEARLIQVRDSTADPELALIVRMRIARLQIEQHQADAALATLAAAEPGAFAARFAEVRGDALLAKGDRDGALKAYREAQGNAPAAPNGPSGDDLLALKINELTHS